MDETNSNQAYVEIEEQISIKLNPYKLLKI